MKKETRKINAPCYKCEERTALCHAICERYKAYEETNAARRKAERVEQMLNAYQAAACDRMKHSRRSCQ